MKPGDSLSPPTQGEALKKPKKSQSVLLATRVEPSLKEAFEAHASARNLKSSELLRRLVMVELGREPGTDKSLPQPKLQGQKMQQVTLRFPRFILDAAQDRATAKGMKPARWMAALVQSHLDTEPVMTEKEVLLLRGMSRELSAIGRNVNQIAKGLNSAVGDIERGRVSLDGLEKVIPAISLSRKLISALIRKSQQSWAAVEDD